MADTDSGSVEPEAPAQPAKTSRAGRDLPAAIAVSVDGSAAPRSRWIVSSSAKTWPTNETQSAAKFWRHHASGIVPRWRLASSTIRGLAVLSRVVQW